MENEQYDAQVEAAYKWWKWMTGPDDENRKVAIAVGRIRRCLTRVDILFITEARKLAAGIPGINGTQAAELAGALAYVREDDNRPFAEAIGEGDDGEALRALLETKESERMWAMRETVKRLEGRVNVRGLARTILQWNKDGCASRSEERDVETGVPDGTGERKESEEEGLMQEEQHDARVEIAYEWWKSMTATEVGDRAKRVALADMRRAHTRIDVILVPDALQLVEEFPEEDYNRAALLAGVLAYVRNDDNRRVVRAIGKDSVKEANTAVVREARFNQLLKTEESGLMEPMRDIVRALDGTVNVRDLARMMLQWGKGDWDKTRIGWLLDYSNLQEARSRLRMPGSGDDEGSTQTCTGTVQGSVANLAKG